MRLKSLIALGSIACISFVFAQEAPVGSPSKIGSKEQKALEGIKGKINGKIVWSSSRSSSKHDIWIMNADGTEPKQLTNSPNNVDWFPRFSSDGAKVVFTRSKSGFVPEGDAEFHDKWDVWMINVDGSGEVKVAENASWGTWCHGDEEVVFARGAKVVKKNISTGEEKEIWDAATAIKKGTYSQQPSLSSNGNLLTVTLRGSSRETGIWNFEEKKWYKTGGGCQIIFFPGDQKVIRMNEGQGNGGTEVLWIPIAANGEPTVKLTSLKEIRFIDLPGRISHEYFPKTDQHGQYLVWAATQSGHEHDMADYEIFIWKIGDKKENAVRLTFHSGNDRWPDLFLHQ